MKINAPQTIITQFKTQYRVGLIFLLLLFPMTLMAKNYLLLSSEKDGRNYKNSAVVIEVDQNKEMAQLDLGTSYKIPGNFILTKDKSQSYFYQQTSKHKASLKVFDNQDQSLKYTLDIGQIDYAIDNLEVFTFFDVSSDFSKLYIQTNEKKVRNIMVFDNKTGALLKKIPLIKAKSYSYLSQNGDYIFTKYLAKGILSIHGTKSLNKVTEFKLKSIRNHGENYGKYIFNHHLVKYRNRKNTYKVEMINLENLEKKRQDIISDGKPIYVVDDINNHFYVAMRDVKTNELALMQLIEGQLKRIDTKGLKLYPKDIVFHENSDKLLIIGRKSNVVFDRSNPEQIIEMDLPFDIASTIWKPEDNLLFLREGSGSEVALFDTQSGNKIGRSGTGRAGVKFGKFMASVAYSVAQYSIGYVAFAYGRTSTEMMLNNNQDKLYAINTKTNDVTQFMSENLSGRKSIATGSGTAFIYQHQQHNDSLFVLSSKKATVINDKDFSVAQQIKFDQLVGLDIEDGVFFVNQNDQINMYSMIDGLLISTLPVINNVKSIVSMPVE
ncbi:MAG: YncE family protein [Marinicellaceae bacterium]